MICAICGSDTRPAFEKGGYAIHGCNACGHQAAQLCDRNGHVERIYGDQYFSGGGDGYPDYLAEAELLTAHGKRYGAMLSRYSAPGRVLDVGAAAGFLLDGLQQSGWQGVGLEPNRRMADYARKALGLSMVVGDLEHIDEQIGRFDLVSMIQVIGHFHNLAGAMARAASVTSGGGYWLIESWNRASLPARLLGEAWHEYSPPSVLHWFTPDDLTKLAGNYGFRLVAQGQPQKWINAAHAKSLLRYKLAALPGYPIANRLLHLVPDKLALPYPAFDLVWMLFQKANDDNGN